MSLATRMRERFRVRLARFVEKERARRGSAKEAMAAVSRKIGLSAVSIYRIMNGYAKPVKVEDHHHAALLMHSLGIVRMAEKIRARRHRAAMHA